MKLRQAMKIVKSECAKECHAHGIADAIKPSNFAVSYNKYQSEKASQRLCKMGRFLKTALPLLQEETI